jgi:phenylalanyl-tRNA synthetase alpha chain
MMLDQIDQLLKAAKDMIESAPTMQALEEHRVHYLGKKGKLTTLLKSISQMPAKDRPIMGQRVNQAKNTVNQWIQTQQGYIQERLLLEQAKADKIDVTLPGRGMVQGHQHPLTRVKERAVQLFKGLGFSIVEGFEVEDELHNFDALNFKAYHPAKTDMDTFYFENGLLLRTHTSPVQIRVMRDEKPPIRVVTAGRVYRRDSDHTHTPMFHQLEGFVVDKTSTFVDLKSTLYAFVQAFFEEKLKLRFRPSYFPFTEPSAEVDVECMLCHGADKDCKVCHEGWLEVLGCGMIHPNVLQGVGIDSNEYQGYAFGVGLDRLAMLLYRISDLRMLFENDLRFLNNF